VAVALRGLAPVADPPAEAVHGVLDGVAENDPERARAAMQDVVGRPPRTG
jgi:hypothetical protein